MEVLCVVMKMSQAIYQVYLKKTCERVARGGGGRGGGAELMGEGQNVLGLFESTCIILQTKITSDFKNGFFLSLYSLISIIASSGLPLFASIIFFLKFLMHLKNNWL